MDDGGGDAAAAGGAEARVLEGSAVEPGRATEDHGAALPDIAGRGQPLALVGAAAGRGDGFRIPPPDGEGAILLRPAPLPMTEASRNRPSAAPDQPVPG